MCGRIAGQRALLRHPMLFDRLLQEALRRSDIAPFTQEKIDGLPILVNPAIEVAPASFDLYVGFVDTPRHSNRPDIWSPPLLKFGHVALNPAHNGGVGQLYMALRPHLRQVSVAQ